MRIAIVTKHSEEYRKLARYSLGNLRRYCEHHGYDLIDDRVPPSRHRPLSYSKLEALIRHLDEYDWIAWADADVLVMRQELSLERFISENHSLVAAQFMRGDGRPVIHAGFFLVKSTHLIRVFLHSVLEDKRFYGDPQREETAMMELSRQIPGMAKAIKYVPIGDVCTIPSICSKPELSYYQGTVPVYDPSRFILHVTLFPTMDDRVNYMAYIEEGQGAEWRLRPELMSPSRYNLREVFLQTTTACNGRCITCPHGEVYNSMFTMMSDSLWEKLVRELKTFQGIIALAYNYEPFTDPDILSRIRQLRDETLGIIAVTTNCALIGDADISALAKDPPDLMLCSLVAPDRQTYEHRTGLPYDRVVDTIRRLSAVLPKVLVNCSAASPEEVDLFRTTFPDLDLILTGLDSRGGLRPEFANSVRSHFFHYADFCTLPFKNIAVRVDGIVPACCLDWGLNTTIAGDANTESLLDILDGSVMDNLRYQLYAGKCPTEPCKTCTKEFGYRSQIHG